MSETVRQRIREELAGELHAIVATQRSSETVYSVVSRSVSAEEIETAPDADFPVLDIRTVAIDLETEMISETDNGIWLPRETDAIEEIISSLARSITDSVNGEPVGAPLERSSIEDLDPELILDRELEEPDELEQNISRMEREPGIDPSREWGYGAGPPPEIETVIDRLEGVGIDPLDVLIRLNWGKKSPHDAPREPVDDLDHLTGNYGIEPLARESGLLMLDVDYPEQFPREIQLPETLEISSPHGDDRRRHLIYYCPDKTAVSDAIGGVWSTDRASWGELWLGNRYVVGAGSELSAYGCDLDHRSEGDSEACPRCEDPDRGYYRIVADPGEIAEIDPETVIETLPEDPTPDIDSEGAEELIESHVECDACGNVIHERDAESIELGGREVVRHADPEECGAR